MTRQSTTAYKQIKDKIISGEYAPSSNLPELDLSNKFNASRNTIKKVLLMLEKEGLVSIELNKGAKVRSYSIDEVLEFLDLRATLEGFIIRRTVPIISDKEIKKLEGILETMEKLSQKKELLLYSKENQKFHQVIYEACPNKISIEITTTLKNQMAKYNTKTILIPGRSTQSLDEHALILAAIKEKDCDLAGKRMEAHIYNVRQTFEDNHALLF